MLVEEVAKSDKFDSVSVPIRGCHASMVLMVLVDLVNNLSGGVGFRVYF